MANAPAPAKPGGTWSLQDAKTHFSEVVRRARDEGPQRVTVRGHDAVVVMATEEVNRLLPTPSAAERLPFVDFMKTLAVDGFDLAREPDHGRDEPV